MKRFSIYILLFLGTFLNVLGNNVRIENLKLIDRQTLSFEVKWEHGWKSKVNHDAVWVFIKAKEHQNWKSVPVLSVNAGSVLKGETGKSNVGFMLSRINEGSGNIDNQKIIVTLKENLTDEINAIQVHGIEMVYIPQGSFYVGDGVSNSTLQRNPSGTPFYIQSEESINGLQSKDQYSPAINIPATFPKGFHPFYMMKYEISQEQYAAFLNDLTFKQQKNRTTMPPNAPSGTYALSFDGTYQNRNGIVILKSGSENEPAVYGLNANPDNPPNYEDDGGNRACNFLAWSDMLAYLDWAGLRPMTELEFEKACRGAEQKPIPKEFAWATPYVIDANTIIEDGTPSETVSETANDSAGVASHGYEGPWGALRCGFGATTVSNRLQAGTGFYGAFEMSGNLWEVCITVQPEGIIFDGAHGDGNLDAEGFADVNNWLPDGKGAGYRGGAWLSGIFANFRDLAVSDRFYGGLVPVMRRNTSGGRGVISWE